MRRGFTAVVRGPGLRAGDAVTALRAAGVSMTLHPPGSFYEAPNDERFEVVVPTDAAMTQPEFEATIRTAVAGTGFRREGGILPRS